MGAQIFGDYLFDAAQYRLEDGEGGDDWTYGFNVERLATGADMQALAHVRQAAADMADASPAL